MPQAYWNHVEGNLVVFVYYIKMKCTDRLDSLNKLFETMSPFIKLDKAKQFQQQEKMRTYKNITGKQQIKLVQF